MSLISCSMNSSFYVINNYYSAIIEGVSIKDISAKSMNFDFNKYRKEGDVTFEEKFRMQTTNELGESILPAVAEVLIRQFRHFMTWVSYEIIKRNHDNNKISYEKWAIYVKKMNQLAYYNVYCKIRK